MMRYTPAIRPLVLTGPSGSGRTVMAFKLITEFPKKFARALSYTSRTPRRNEIDGVHYYFLTKEQMQGMNSRGEFLTLKKDAATGETYGTSINEINRIASMGEAPVLEMSARQYSQLREKVACNGIYIRPESTEALRTRLSRETLLSSQQIEEKLEQGRQQEQYVTDNQLFPERDIILNSNLNEAYVRLKARLFQLY